MRSNKNIRLTLSGDIIYNRYIYKGKVLLQVYGNVSVPLLNININIMNVYSISIVYIQLTQK